jgi:hypothetical protein
MGFNRNRDDASKSSSQTSASTASPEQKPGATERDPDLEGVEPADEFVRKTPDPPPPLIQGIIHPGEVGFISGAPNGGKTYLAMELMRAVTTGTTALGRFTAQQGNVVFLEAEGQRHFLKQRLIATGLAGAKNLHIKHRSQFSFGKRADVDQLARTLKLLKADLLVVDPLASYHDADENSFKEMGAVVKEIQRLATECPKTAFLYLHHDNKGGQQGETNRRRQPSLAALRGHSVLAGAIDVAFAVAKDSSTHSKLELTLSPTKLRDAAFPDPQKFIRDFTKVGAAAWSLVGDSNSPAHKEKSLRQRILDALGEYGPFPSLDALAKQLQLRAAQVREAVDELMQEEPPKVIRTKHGREVEYRLTDAAGATSV